MHFSFSKSFDILSEWNPSHAKFLFATRAFFKDAFQDRIFQEVESYREIKMRRNPFKCDL
jgi:hypothetical protein